nr:capsid protein [Reptile-associated circular DNA molecule]
MLILKKKTRKNYIYIFSRKNNNLNMDAAPIAGFIARNVLGPVARGVANQVGQNIGPVAEGVVRGMEFLIGAGAGKGITDYIYEKYFKKNQNFENTSKYSENYDINNVKYNTYKMARYNNYPTMRGGPYGVYSSNYRRYRRGMRRRAFRRYTHVSPYYKGTRAILDYIYGASIGGITAGDRYNHSLQVSQFITQTQGWSNFAALYNQFRIYFVKVELIPTPPNTIINASAVTNFIYNNPVFYYIFDPSNDTLSYQEVWSNNLSGKSSAAGVIKRCIRRFRKGDTSPGYGLPMTTTNASSITGRVSIASTQEVYQGVAPGTTDIFSVHIYLYIQFSNATA